MSLDVWRKILDVGLRGFIKTGTLHVTWPDMSQTVYGDGSGDQIELAIADTALIRGLITNPDMAMGDGYMSGRITFGNDDLDGFLELALKNRSLGGGIIFRSSRVLRQIKQGRFQRIAKTIQFDIAEERCLLGFFISQPLSRFGCRAF